jgi:hypothetical protein
VAEVDEQQRERDSPRCGEDGDGDGDSGTGLEASPKCNVGL